MFDRLNEWYDTLPEPYRFLTFVLPLIISLSGISCPHGYINTPSGLIFMLMVFWGLSRYQD